MTPFTYNTRILALSIIINVGLVFVYLSLVKECKDLKWLKGNVKKFKILSMPILIIFILFISIFFISSLASKNDPEITIEITSIEESSGLGGFRSLSSYTVRGITNEGEKISLYVNILMPSKFKKKIEELDIGEIVLIKYEKKLNNIYLCEKMEPQM